MNGDSKNIGKNHGEEAGLNSASEHNLGFPF